MTILATILPWLATYAIHSTVMLMIVFLVTRHIVRDDAWREMLWKTALIGSILTATVQSGAGVSWVGRRLPLFAAAPAAVRHDVMPPATPLAPSPAIADHAPDYELRASNASGEVAASVVNPRRRISPTAVATGMWLAIATLLCARLALRHARLFRALRHRTDVDDAGALFLLATLRRQAGLSREIRLTTAAVCPGPLAFGAREICVPPRFLSELSTSEQASALAHELAHLSRRDPQWHLVAGIAESIFIFQPLNRVARMQLREAAENLCDDWAVKQTGSAVDLARCLSKVAGWMTPNGVAVPSGTMAMADGGSPLLLRVRRILDHGDARATRRGRSVAALLMLACVGAAAPVVSRAAPVAPRAAVPEAPRQEAARPEASRPEAARTVASTAKAPTCETIARDLDIGTGGWLSLLNYNNSARIEGSDRSNVSVSVRKCAYAQERLAEASFEIERHGNGYHLESVYADPRKKSWNLDDPTNPKNPATFDYVIRVPRGIELRDIHVIGGRLEITGVHGGVQAEATNGPLVASDVRGALDLSSSNGTVDVTLDRSPTARIRLQSVNGPVVLKLPEGARASLFASTEKGRIVSDIQLDRAWGLRGQGQLNGGGAEISITSMFDEVRIQVAGSRTPRSWVIASGSDAVSDSDMQNADESSPRAERIPVSAAAEFAAERAARASLGGPDGAIISALLDLTSHEPRHPADLIRDRAVWALTQIEDGVIRERLIEAAVTSLDWRVRANAAFALAYSPEPQTERALLLLLRDRHWRVRLNATYSLGSIHSAKARTGLTPLLHDPEWQVRAGALDNLAIVGATAAIPAMRALLTDPHIGVRESAAAAIEALQNSQSRDSAPD